MNVIHLSANDSQMSLYTGCPTKGWMGAHGSVLLRVEALSYTLQETVGACGVCSIRSHASMLHLRARTPRKLAAAREKPSIDAVVLTLYASVTYSPPFWWILQSPQSIQSHLQLGPELPCE